MTNRVAISSQFEMSISGFFDYDSLSGYCTVTVFAEDDPVLLNLRLRIAVTESGIYYQAPNGALIHNYIFREMIPSVTGHEIDIHQGETKQYTFPFNVLAPLDPENCMLVALIQSDQNQEILQSTRIKIPDLNSTTSAYENNGLPSRLEMPKNYPNPFNSSTRIKCDVETGNVSVMVYDITGSLVTVLFEGDLVSGPYEFNWDGSDCYKNQVSSGIYYYRIKNNNTIRVNKMTLLK